jgi:hypothetical protein
LSHAGIIKKDRTGRQECGTATAANMHIFYFRLQDKEELVHVKQISFDLQWISELGFWDDWDVSEPIEIS